jgi:hypothetical protein
VGNQTCIGNFVDVSLERERGNIGLKATDYRARLRATALVRLLELDFLSGFFFPICLECWENGLSIGFA